MARVTQKSKEMASVKAKNKAKSNAKSWRQIVRAIGITSIGIYENAITVRGNSDTAEEAAREYLRSLGKNPL